MNRHKTLVVEDVKKVSYCGTALLHLKGGEYEIPFETKPTRGSHNLKDCKGCQRTYKHVLNDVIERFDSFPDCCKYHSNLTKLDFFNKEDFKDAPEFIANKILFCYHHVINNLDNEDWYQDYLQYMEYTEESFGKMPSKCGQPFMISYFYDRFSELINKITEDDLKSDTISKQEIKIRLQKVKNSIIPYPKVSESIMSELLSIYDKWYSIFPFDFPYFKHLKSEYQKVLPLNTGRTRYNRYLNITIPETHTKESLTQVLIDITNNIITSINGVTLYEKGLLNDVDNISLQLIINQRKLNLEKFKFKPKDNTKKYVKSLNFWFKGEKNFLNEIKPYLKSKPKLKNKFSQKQVAIAYYFLDLPINEDTYLAILQKYTSTTSNKILQKLIVKTSQLTSLSENKTADSKHLKDLNEAKRLISGIKNKDAKNSIDQVISTFETNYKNHYE